MKRLFRIASVAFALSFIGGDETRALGQSTESGHFGWLASMINTVDTIKPGMTIEDLLKVFRREGGGGFSRITTKNGVELVHTYVLQKCPIIKIDVKFEGQFTQEDPKTGSKILWVSKPYLEHEIID